MPTATHTRRHTHIHTPSEEASRLCRVLPKRTPPSHDLPSPFYTPCASHTALDTHTHTARQPANTGVHVCVKVSVCASHPPPSLSSPSPLPPITFAQPHRLLPASFLCTDSACAHRSSELHVYPSFSSRVRNTRVVRARHHHSGSIQRLSPQRAPHCVSFLLTLPSRASTAVGRGRKRCKRARKRARVWSSCSAAPLSCLGGVCVPQLVVLQLSVYCVQCWRVGVVLGLYLPARTTVADLILCSRPQPIPPTPLCSPERFSSFPPLELVSIRDLRPALCGCPFRLRLRTFLKTPSTTDGDSVRPGAKLHTPPPATRWPVA